jgi:integrase
LLQLAIEHGKITKEELSAYVEMKEKAKYLQMHKYTLWEGQNGRWYTYLPTPDGGRRLIKKSTKNKIEAEIVAYWRGEIENPTIDEVFEEWNNRRLELKKISPASHSRNKQYYERHYGEFGKEKIKSTTWEDFEEFLEEQIPRYNLTAKAFAGLKGVTKGLLIRAKKRGLIDFDFITGLAEMEVSDNDFAKRVKNDDEEVYDDVEFAQIVQYLMTNLDLHNMGILLIFLTGIRVGELVTLKHNDFNGNAIAIRRTETRIRYPGYSVFEVKDFPKSKAGVRTVIVPEEYEWLILKLLSEKTGDDFIFTRTDGSRLSTSCIRKRLATINKKLGITQKSPHKIRKTFASILLDNKLDNRLITELMGHTDIACTENHYHRNRRNLEMKSEIINNIPEFQAL